ncbi:MAG: c-type cytochrome [Aquificaceae bacterium]|nr:c-type cytochrome [Aquificaceae bacterium]
MVKYLLLFTLSGLFLLYSCQQKPAEQSGRFQATPQTAQVKDVKAFAQQKGCFSCHDVENRRVGPAFKEVAKKYAKEQDAVEHLAEEIIKGGVGAWGNVPMPPQNLTEQEAKDAKWILSMK